MSHVNEMKKHREDNMQQDNAQLDQPVQPEPVTQKPVAYDANGNPLYAAPTDQIPVAQPPQVVHMARAVEPVEVEISPETKLRHDASVRDFPWINLSDHEYVVNAIRRHSIGLLGPLAATIMSVALILVFVLNYPFVANLLGLSMSLYGLVLLGGVLLVVLFVILGYLSIWVYTNNRFFLTNESVIQEIQTSVFSKREQTVSLMNIEDASYSQKGPLQTLLNYGSIRLSTEGEETTYQFDYVESPKRQVAILNNAVEAFKNGRPVSISSPANDD